MASKDESDAGLVREGDAILLRCDKVYKPAVVERGKYVLWCALFRIYIKVARDSYSNLYNLCLGGLGLDSLH